MGFRDRIDDARGKLRDELTGLVAGPDGSASPEGFVLGLVRTARDDEEEELTEKQVRKDARKRRRRLGIASFAAGPLAGAAGEATDLYTETATVCDLVELHDLTLSDLDIGAQMLVLWDVVDDVAAGRATLEGSGPPIADALRERWGETLREHLPSDRSVLSVVKSIWRLRQARDALTAGGSLARVFRAGSQTKDFVARAERQLGV